MSEKRSDRVGNYMVSAAMAANYISSLRDWLLTSVGGIKEEDITPERVAQMESVEEGLKRVAEILGDDGLFMGIATAQMVNSVSMMEKITRREDDGGNE